MQGLNDLNATGNTFESFDLLNINQDIVNINLQNNQLEQLAFPSNLEFLNSLDVSNNNLTELSINQANNLSYLDVSNNQIQHLLIDNFDSLNYFNEIFKFMGILIIYKRIM